MRINLGTLYALLAVLATGYVLGTLTYLGGY